MKEYSDNLLQKFDNLGLRNKELKNKSATPSRSPNKDNLSLSNNKKSSQRALPSNKQYANSNSEISIKDFNVYTTLGTGTFGRVRQARFKQDPSKKIYA